MRCTDFEWWHRIVRFLFCYPDAAKPRFDCIALAFIDSSLTWTSSTEEITRCPSVFNRVFFNRFFFLIPEISITKTWCAQPQRDSLNYANDQTSSIEDEERLWLLLLLLLLLVGGENQQVAPFYFNNFFRFRSLIEWNLRASAVTDAKIPASGGIRLRFRDFFFVFFSDGLVA